MSYFGSTTDSSPRSTPFSVLFPMLKPLAAVALLSYASSSAAETSQQVAIYVISEKSGKCQSEVAVSEVFRGPSDGAHSPSAKARAACRVQASTNKCSAISQTVREDFKGFVSIVKSRIRCYDGSPTVRYGLGVGSTAVDASLDAEKNLATRAWAYNKKKHTVERVAASPLDFRIKPKAMFNDKRCGDWVRFRDGNLYAHYSNAFGWAHATARLRRHGEKAIGAWTKVEALLKADVDVTKDVETWNTVTRLTEVFVDRTLTLAVGVPNAAYSATKCLAQPFTSSGSESPHFETCMLKAVISGSPLSGTLIGAYDTGVKLQQLKESDAAFAESVNALRIASAQVKTQLQKLQRDIDAGVLADDAVRRLNESKLEIDKRCSLPVSDGDFARSRHHETSAGRTTDSGVTTNSSDFWDTPASTTRIGN